MHCGAELNPPVEGLGPGVVLKDYLLLRPLGQGGMATVYLARQLSLDRLIALKVLSMEGKDEEFVGRFLQEARFMASLNHPNVVQIYAVDFADGYYFLAMEYVDGPTLLQRLTERISFSEKDTLQIGMMLAEVLGMAWREKQLLHSDIKPENILVDSSGRLKLADFGLASRGSHTADGTMIYGTPQYLAPELLLGAPRTVQSDIYSLGVMMVQLLTGKLLFDGNDAEKVAEMHLKERIALSKRFWGKPVSNGMKALLSGMLAKRPCQRFPDYPSLLRDMKRVSKGEMPVFVVEANADEPIRSDSLSPLEAVPAKPAKSGGASVYVAVILVLLFVLAGFLMLSLLSGKREEGNTSLMESETIVEEPAVVVPKREFPDKSSVTEERKPPVESEKPFVEEDTKPPVVEIQPKEDVQQVRIPQIRTEIVEKCNELDFVGAIARLPLNEHGMSEEFRLWLANWKTVLEQAEKFYRTFRDSQKEFAEVPVYVLGTSKSWNVKEISFDKVRVVLNGNARDLDLRTMFPPQYAGLVAAAIQKGVFTTDEKSQLEYCFWVSRGANLKQIASLLNKRQSRGKLEEFLLAEIPQLNSDRYFATLLPSLEKMDAPARNEAKQYLNMVYPEAVKEHQTEWEALK